MKWSYRYVEYGGYDCMTDAFFVEDENYRNIVVIDQAGHGQEGRDHGYKSPSAEALARLIASAPELLAALKQWQAVCECETPEQSTAYNMAEAAIAKAEGP